MLAGMKRWIVVALVGAGCYRASPPPASPDPPRPVAEAPQASQARPHTGRPLVQERSMIADAIAKLGEFADDMCACADRTCADQVQQDMTRWTQGMAQDHDELKPTAEEMEEATRVTERLSRCMVTAMGYGAPTTPPTP